MSATFTLRQNDLLIMLPAFTEQISRTQESGLEVHTLGLQTYDPVHGTVIQKGSKAGGIRIGDIVYFQIFTFSTGRERVYGDNQNDLLKHEYLPVRHFSFVEDGQWYMIIPQDEIYFFERWEHYIMTNGFVIATPVIKTDLPDNTIIEADLSNKNYQLNQAIIAHSCDAFLVPGDHVLTLRHCDITIEETFNHLSLTADSFIIEFKNIIAKKMGDTYIAAPKRVIVLPDEIDTQTSSGLINLERQNTKLLTGTIISDGSDVKWPIGSKVFYARNSGMPIPDTDYIILADIDIAAGIATEEK